MTGVAEEAARLLVRFGRRYAAAVRLATLVPICAVALFRASPEHFAATASMVAVAAVWTCGYVWWLRRGRGDALLAPDVIVLLTLTASVTWTGALEDTNFGWSRLLVTFACVTWQWHTSLPVGAAVALVAGGGAAVIVAMAVPDPSVIRGNLWAVPAAALSRAAWTLLRQAADRADRMAAEAARARAAAQAAAAVRAEERELANALHDTAATTLLMVGTGQVRSDSAWLGPQARRDLDRLRSDSRRTPRPTDLVDLLRADLDAAQLSVEFDLPARLPLPAGVAAPIADAAREALTNVRRHSGTTRATVRLRGDSRSLRLDIIDEGKGFSLGDVPGHRRGIRESVRGRMTRIGGTATVVSAEGEGTRVRLEWPAGHD
ncbi:sensor histidine kinase [Nonomuraea sp. NPDC050478]|uniref:sensor histidine kinase n=1 Tax=Nonomuraea sp. NPDC050478 TaxID=3364365 RepID=UPI003788788C